MFRRAKGRSGTLAPAAEGVRWNGKIWGLVEGCGRIEPRPIARNWTEEPMFKAKNIRRI